MTDSTGPGRRAYPKMEGMRILMAGASGFLGTRLVDLLVADGHQ